MLGIVYLFLCFIVGYVICMVAFPNLSKLHETTFRGKRITLSSSLLLVPAWYLTGTLCMTWLTYLMAYLFQDKRHPLSYANTIVIIIAVIGSSIGIAALKLKKKGTFNLNRHFYRNDLIYFLIAFVLVTVLMFRTFYIADGKLNLGLSVFSDFSPHLSMIRSFSYGNNFPTSYGHFAGEDIRYHFMFQFLVGNLEFLGMRIDFAFNIPSILSLVSVFSLLYVLAMKITGSKAAAYLSGLFFAFRSSPSLFRYLADLQEGEVVSGLKSNIEFIGETVNENWGLWNLNVYCNQRHFAFGLAVLILSLILLLPLFYEQQERLYSYLEKKKNDKSIWILSDCFRLSFYKKEGWNVKNYKLAIGAGIMLGSIAFWNGAVLICALAILFLLAVFSDRRLELLITAVIATVLSLLQSAFFIDNSPVSANYFFGFIAPNKTVFGVSEYIIELTGILFLVLFAAFILQKGAEKYIIFAFLIPFILAFTLSLTVDVTVNHKNIMLSIMLLGVFLAWFVVELFRRREISAKIGAVILVFLLTATGVYDFVTVLARNVDRNNLKYDINDELTLWVKENTTSNDIFLTSNYYIHPLVLGGAMLYDGWQYYAWSAGYNTQYRDEMVKRMYETSSPEELISLVGETNIRFIVVESSNREAAEYIVNEENIANTYLKVYEMGSGDLMFSIYDTMQLRVYK